MANFRIVFPLVLCAGLLAPGPHSNAEVILLRNGEVLEAESFEYAGDFALMVLNSGGVLSLPLEQIDSILPSPASVVAEGPACFERADTSLGAIHSLIVQIAEEQGLDPALVRAVVRAESNFDPRAVSARGACGLMQLLPETAERYDVTELFDPAENLRAGVRHLKYLMARYPNRLDLALAAYNAGEGRVDRTGGIPAIAETRRYVERILADYRPRR